jgi:glutathione S-transferase
VPNELFSVLGLGVGGADAIKEATDAMKRDLASLCYILMEQPYLVTDQPTLADFAVAGLTMYVKFPAGNYVDIPESLKGKGVSGIADIGTFEPFFSWRDRLYADYRRIGVPSSTTSSSDRPTSINID